LSLTKAQAELDHEHEMMTQFDAEIKELDTAIKSKNAQSTEVLLQMSQLAHEVERFYKDKQTAQQAIKEMEESYEWITHEKQ
jgi:structural maintenance of chromosome 2